MRRDAAVRVARWARERVPLYRALYAGAPPTRTWADVRRLPVLTTARLRATPLCEQVDALDDVLRSQTAYLIQSVVTPRTLVLDEDDSGAAFDQTRDAFALIGVRRGTRVVLVATPEQRYCAAEITDQLGYFRIEAHLVIATDRAALLRTLDALRPARVVSLGVEPPAGESGWVTARRPDLAGVDLYVVPEAGIAAVRPEGGSPYRVLTKYCLLEAAHGGGLLLTALRRYHQPLIRYKLADRGRVRGGRLWLEELAP